MSERGDKTLGQIEAWVCGIFLLLAVAIFFLGQDLARIADTLERAYPVEVAGD